MSSLPSAYDRFRIPLQDIVTATGNFEEENLLKQGEHACVYKGLLLLRKEWINVVVRRYRRKHVSSLGVILLEVLYGRKATIEDVNQYLAIMAEEARQVDDIIAPNLRPQMDPQSLSIFSKTIYDCLKEQLDDERRLYMFEIAERLEKAFDIQREHENLCHGVSLWMANMVWMALSRWDISCLWVLFTIPV
ncbi:hypothetical protein L1987_54125 [Smallanthus sonchifolius]|uniref:Uncharacterized protein n=1 Tax=Smallanthus sonchifolius TaxID=185202 RepID=A0ACB9E5U1_9ASTR|nr:hypothetical protein L1987_54125 [Smallanthus sonchifolius]